MTRLVSSHNALAALVLLSQRSDGLRISEGAALLEISYTGAGKALAILVADGLATRSDHHYLLIDSARSREAIRFALASLPFDEALADLARANPAVEFCGIDAAGGLIVIRRFAEPADEVRLHQGIAALAEFNADSRVQVTSKDDVRDQLLDDVASRRRASRMRVLAGSVDRTFPDRTHHGDVEGRRLGRLNPRAPRPSQRRLQALARRHRLRRIVVFGSATRSDFRPDSDIDLLVEPAPGHQLGLFEQVGLMAEADRLFGRDVDLLTPPVHRPSLAARIEREGVVLYDAAGSGDPRGDRR